MEVFYMLFVWFSENHELVVDWDHVIVDYQYNYCMHSKKLNDQINLNKYYVQLIHDDSACVFADNENNQSNKNG
jgi:hypothetical protein